MVHNEQMWGLKKILFLYSKKPDPMKLKHMLAFIAISFSMANAQKAKDFI